MSWRDDLKRFNGPYYQWALENRQKFLVTEITTETKLAKEVEDMVKDLSKSIENMPSDIAAQMRYVKDGLKDFAKALGGKQTDTISKGIEKAVGIGVEYNKKISADLLTKAFPGVAEKIENVFGAVQEDVIKAMWNRRVGGLYLSDRIWYITADTTENIGKILTAGIAENMDPVDIARALTKYVQEGSATLVKDYPNMMKRMGKRLPKDLNYEALRLVRTEVSAAHGDATVKSATYNPACKGLKWVLSAQHPEQDICDELANAEQGMGPGVYPIEDPPPMPAHPNCLCFFTEWVEDPNAFMQRLERFRDNPDADPELQQYWERTFGNRSGKVVSEERRTLKEVLEEVKELDVPEEVKKALLDHYPYDEQQYSLKYAAQDFSEENFMTSAIARWISGNTDIQTISTDLQRGLIDKWLPIDKLDEYTQNVVRWIKTALNLMDESEPYKNELIRVERFGANPDLQKIKKGDKLKLGIRSWSQKDEFLEETGEMYCEMDGKFVTYRVKGAKALNISPFSWYNDEYEVLTSGEFEVVDIKKQKFRNWRGETVGEVINVILKQVSVFAEV